MVGRLTGGLNDNTYIKHRVSQGEVKYLFESMVTFDFLSWIKVYLVFIIALVVCSRVPTDSFQMQTHLFGS